MKKILLIVAMLVSSTAFAQSHPLTEHDARWVRVPSNVDMDSKQTFPRDSQGNPVDFKDHGATYNYGLSIFLDKVLTICEKPNTCDTEVVIRIDDKDYEMTFAEFKTRITTGMILPVEIIRSPQKRKPARKYAHAPQTPKPANIVAPASNGEIRMPEKENAMLKDLQVQLDLLRTDYKISEYEKEQKALAEIYQNGIKTLEAKYKLVEFQGKIAPINAQANTVIQFAAIDAKLTDQQKASLELHRDEKTGDWVWRPKVETTKEK